MQDETASGYGRPFQYGRNMLVPPIQKLRSYHYLNRLNIGWQTMAYIPRTVTENPAQPGIRLQIDKKSLYIHKNEKTWV